MKRHLANKKFRWNNKMKTGFREITKINKLCYENNCNELWRNFGKKQTANNMRKYSNVKVEIRFEAQCKTQ